MEGQKLIHDLALIRPLQEGGFQYFRDVILSIELMTTLLKRGEQLGFYIDAEEPYFRLKIETNFAGYMRGMLYPDDFRIFPKAVTGSRTRS